MTVCTSAKAEVWLSPLLQDHPLVGKLFDLNANSEIAETDLLARLTSTRYVLVGEKHDNPDHYRIEEKLLSFLLGRNTDSGVVFEMLDDSQQDFINKLSPSDSLADMKETLQWPAHGWDWQRYGTLFKLTLDAGATIVPGNVNTDRLKQVYQSGQSALAPVERFQSMVVLSDEERSQIQQQVYESHCEMMPFEALTPMVTVQVAKDASMAYAMTQQEFDSVILIAGGFHVSKDIGVPRHLRKLEPGVKPVVVMMLEVEEGSDAYEDYAESLQGVADYVWFTPKATDKDYCEGLRKHKKM